MTAPEFPPNSDKSKGVQPPEKKVEKVVTGVVIKKPKPIGSRFKNVFFGGDFRSAARYIGSEVLLPAIRMLMVDSVTRGAEKLVLGDTRRSGIRPIAQQYQSRIQYNTPLLREPRSTMLPNQPPHIPRATRQSFGDLILSSREEAELVLERLVDLIDQFQVASVADLKELVGFPIANIDQKWGWTSLGNVVIRQVREGYLIDLPGMEAI